MGLPDIQVSGNGMDITDAIHEYIVQKMTKYERIFDVATTIKVECTAHVAARGVDQDFRVEISMHLPRVVARVEKDGGDLYAIVDEITDVLARKVKRYKDKLRQWEGKIPWKIAEAGASLDTEDLSEDVYTQGYTPRVVKRKKIEDCTPISEEEAIERMEMLGHESFLFKSRDTKRFAMVYKRKRGGYGIVEPCE